MILFAFFCPILGISSNILLGLDELLRVFNKIVIDGYLSLIFLAISFEIPGICANCNK